MGKVHYGVHCKMRHKKTTNGIHPKNRNVVAGDVKKNKTKQPNQQNNCRRYSIVDTGKTV